MTGFPQGSAVSGSVIETRNVVAAAGAAQSIPSPTSASMSRLTLTAASCALTLPSPVAGATMSILLVQDGTGNRVVTWAGGAVVWAGGVVPSLQAGANAADEIVLVAYDTTTWRGSHAAFYAS